MNKQIICILITLFLFSCSNKNEQDDSIAVLTVLQKTSSLLPEISGLAFKDSNTVYAHNDGGHSASIFQLPLDAEMASHITNVFGETNFDWEELADDEDNLYVGEFGNNFGDRQDLRVLKLSKDEMDTAPIVVPQNIRFSYKDQESFDPGNKHNYDCEAMIHHNEQLVLFTKNRGNGMTHVYELPTQSGDYELERVDEFYIGGLVTGADMNEDETVLALLCYNFAGMNSFESFLWLFHDFQGTDYFSGKSTRLQLSQDGQFEAICFRDNLDLVVSAESESGFSDIVLYNIDLAKFVN